MIKKGIVLLAVVLLGACGPELDYKLEGKWQLKQVTSDAGVETVDTVYYNFQNNYFMYQIANSAYYNGYSYGYKTIEADDKILLEIKDRSFLPHTDWADTARLFSVEIPSHDKLLLKSEGKTYSFKRF